MRLRLSPGRTFRTLFRTFPGTFPHPGQYRTLFPDTIGHYTGHRPDSTGQLPGPLPDTNRTGSRVRESLQFLTGHDRTRPDTIGHDRTRSDTTGHTWTHPDTTGHTAATGGGTTEALTPPPRHTPPPRPEPLLSPGPIVRE